MLHLLREEEVGRAVEEWEEKGKGETPAAHRINN